MGTSRAVERLSLSKHSMLSGYKAFSVSRGVSRSHHHLLHLKAIFESFRKFSLSQRLPSNSIEFLNDWATRVRTSSHEA